MHWRGFGCFGGRRSHASERGFLRGGADHSAPADTFFQTLHPGIKTRQIAGKAFVTKAQQAKLRIGAAVCAVIKICGGFLQRCRQIKKPGGGNILSQAVQRGLVVPAGEERCAALGGCAPQQQVASQSGKLGENGAHVLAAGIELIQKQQGGFHIAVENVLHHLCRLQIAGKTQRVQHGSGVDGAAGGGALIQKGEGVTQSAIGKAAEKLRAVTFQVDLLLKGHMLQPGLNVRRLNALEGKTLAAGEDGGGNLVQFRGGQNEHQMGGGLFQNLQQRVEGCNREHVHLVHNVNAGPHIGGGINGLVPQCAHLVHTVVGGGVQLQHIQQRAALDAKAGGTFTTGVAVYRAFAVDGFGQDLGAGGFAGAAGAGEKVCVGGAALRHLLLQGLGDVALSDHIRKGTGTPLAV